MKSLETILLESIMNDSQLTESISSDSKKMFAYYLSKDEAPSLGKIEKDDILGYFQSWYYILSAMIQNYEEDKQNFKIKDLGKALCMYGYNLPSWKWSYDKNGEVEVVAVEQSDYLAQSIADVCKDIKGVMDGITKKSSYLSNGSGGLIDYLFDDADGIVLSDFKDGEYEEESKKWNDKILAALKKIGINYINI